MHADIRYVLRQLDKERDTQEEFERSERIRAILGQKSSLKEEDKSVWIQSWRHFEKSLYPYLPTRDVLEKQITEFFTKDTASLRSNNISTPPMCTGINTCSCVKCSGGGDYSNLLDMGLLSQKVYLLLRDELRIERERVGFGYSF